MGRKYSSTTGKAISNVKKFKLDALDALEAEAEERQGKDHSNIDPTRSKENRFLYLDEKGEIAFGKSKPEKSLRERALDRIGEVGATLRKDKTEKSEMGGKDYRKSQSMESVACVGLILQASHSTAMEMLREDGHLDENGKQRKDIDLKPEHRTYRYFRDSYKWACKRYGKENVVGCVLHMDEYTPHLHVYIVPLKEKQRKYKDKKWTKWTLDAKHIFNRKELKDIWTDYAEAMKDYGLERVEGHQRKNPEDVPVYDEVASMSKMLEYQNAEYEIKADTIRAQQAYSEDLDKSINEKYMENSRLEKVIDEKNAKLNWQTNELSNLEMKSAVAETEATLYIDSKEVRTGYVLLEMTKRCVGTYLSLNTDERKQNLKEGYISLFCEQDRDFAEKQFNDLLELRMQQHREHKRQEEKKQQGTKKNGGLHR